MSPARTIGPAAILDGLRAYDAMGRERSLPNAAFVDARLMAQGYSEADAARILNHLDHCDFIEWGVSMRSGWLTDKGRAWLADPR